MDVEYDPAKNEKNIRERGLSFERARQFDFATAVLKMVVRNGEVRWTAIGYLDDLLHMICYTRRPGMMRVISFRRAGRRDAGRVKRHRRLDR